MDPKKIAQQNVQELITKLQTSSEGLSEQEVKNRLLQYGTNSFLKTTRYHKLKLFLAQFNNSLVYLLIIACVLSFTFNSINDGIVILFILIINTSLGYFQQSRSEEAIENLQKLVDRDILVLRDNKQILIPEKYIVPGDLVILREGDIVPADIKLTSISDLSVNESQLTGESKAIYKTLDNEQSILYAGSIVEQGEGKGVVFATANHTELGKIAHLSDQTKRVTQFEKSLSIFSGFLIKVTSFTLFVVFILRVIIDHNLSNLGNLALFIVALLIAVVPEAMPVIITLTLSRGALNLAKKHVIAKTLTAVEDLGNINILCSDKTGTLTQNKLKVTNLISDDAHLFQLLALGSLENLDEKRKKFQSSFDKALIDFIPDDLEKELTNFERISELPFDPSSRRRRVLTKYHDSYYLIVIGSAETLIEISTSNSDSGHLDLIKSEGDLGLRHLAIAYRKITNLPNNFDILKNEHDLKFLGFVSLEDPLRKNVKHTIQLAQKLGIEIKILSGDSREVTGYIARQVGLIKNDQKVYLGHELDALSDPEVLEKLQKNNVFARLNPEQKYRIIKLLKLAGNVVGYQGDGINDAPALKLADVAIAVNNATDVAQDSADILLLRNDLSVIINGIRYGREIFANINKYIRYVFVSNWGNFFALAVLFLISGNGLPIIPVQVLLTSLLTELPCFSIATDNVNTTELQRPSKFNIHALMFISIFLGTLTSVFEITYYALIKNNPSTVISTGLYLFLSFTALIVILSIRNKDHFFKAPRFSVPLSISFILILIISIALIYIPETKKILYFSNFPLSLMALTIGLTIVYFVVLDLVKVWFYKTNFGMNLKES